MVFKLKLPPREPRRRLSAREVAKDLGVGLRWSWQRSPILVNMSGLPHRGSRSR